MKVLMLATGYPKWENDSSHSYLHRLAKLLVIKGLEVHVLAPHAKGIKKEEIMDGVYIHRFQYLYPSNIQTLAYFPGIPEKLKTLNGKIQVPFFMLSMSKALLEVVKKYNFDIIYAHWVIPTGFIALFTKRVHKRSIVIKLYGAEIYPFYRKNNITSKIAKRIIRFTLRNVDKIVGNSGPTCKVGEEMSCEKIEILPEGVDLESFNPNRDYYEIINRYKLGDYRIIFSTGRMVERKGFKYLIESIPYILREYPKTKLIIGRDGPDRNNLVKLSVDLGIAENVIFPGIIPNEDLPKFMAVATVFVLPSIVDRTGDTEGLGLVLLEAMACGTPVIGTNVGGIPYIIENGVNGFLVEQKKPGQLAKGIIKLFDEELGQTIGEAGKKYIEENFTWNIITEKCIKILKSSARTPRF